MAKATNYQETLGIDLPSDLLAEQAVLGAALIDPEACETVMNKLHGGEFYDRGHALIYRAMNRIAIEEKPIDLVSLTGKLQDAGELDIVGGVRYLAGLAGSVPSASNVAYYADRVRAVFLKRQAIYSSLELLKEATQEHNIQGFVAMAEEAAAKLTDQAAPASEFRFVKEVLAQTWEDTERRYINRETNRGITGIASGYAELDRMTAGFQRSDLIIVAARPSVGKTAFALNIAQNAGIRRKASVAVFSLEMPAAQLVQRMICAEGNIDAGRMRSGYFEPEDFDRMATAIGNLSEAHIYIDDTPGITVNEIRAKCRRLKKERGLDMVVIDYLQLVQGSGRFANRQEEVSQISRTLKQMAREMDVPVLALSQLSRGVEQRQHKRPLMSDLRESGAIEQDADVIAFLYRDDYYDKASEKKHIIEIIIAKQRNGPVGTVELAFHKSYSKFVSLDPAFKNSLREAEPLRKGTGSRIPDMYRRRISK